MRDISHAVLVILLAIACLVIGGFIFYTGSLWREINSLQQEPYCDNCRRAWELDMEAQAAEIEHRTVEKKYK